MSTTTTTTSTSGDLVTISPRQLEFAIELNKRASCLMQLTNNTQIFIAFKVLTTNPNKYIVRPNMGVLLPGATCDVIVTMDSQKKIPKNMQCKDKFRIQSVIIPPLTTIEDISSETFKEEDGKIVEFSTLLVAYVPANPSSSVSGESEEATSPRSSPLNTGIHSATSESIKKLLRELESDKPKPYSRADLRSFTSNFAYENIIGSGRFGKVYKGQFPNGVQIAVKVLVENDIVEEIFMAEVSTMGKTYHRNLVKLMGFCFENNTKALIYEYMENGSLDKLLCEEHLSIEWEQLCDIVIKMAKALSYLHDDCYEEIIHHDLKATNVLLDSNLSPKLTYFGLAKFMSKEDGSRVTRHYAAPELRVQSTPVTFKCDVYSFGMMLFQVLCRSNNTEEIELFSKQAWEKFEIGQLAELREDWPIREEDRKNAEILYLVAMWCIQYKPILRPSMSTVAKMLEKEIPVMKPLNPFEFL